MKDILFLSLYPVGVAPSQRFRVEQFFPCLAASELSYDIKPFYGNKTFSGLYGESTSLLRIIRILVDFLRRLRILFKLPFYRYIHVQRGATPIGPPWLEWFAVKVFRKKLIYDFDDAIWIEPNPKSFSLKQWLKWHRKVPQLCRWAHVVCCGNTYLADYARQFNEQVVIIPTVVDIKNRYNLMQNHEAPVAHIGWTGSHSTLPYLQTILPALKELEKKFDFSFYVIADKDPKLDLASYVFVPWNKEREIKDLLRFHIGIMPMPETPWTKGKCGFKAIQYMALGIPALVSPVGVNQQIVDHGVSGFHCAELDQWKEHLQTLLKDQDLRKDMGERAKVKILQEYALDAVCKNWTSLFLPFAQNI